MTNYTDLNEERPSRRALIRMAFVWTPIALASLVLCVVAILQIIGGDSGFLFMLFIFGFIGLLTGSQALLYLRDLRHSPIEIQGEVVRKWHKGNLFFFFLPTYYITVDSKVSQGSVQDITDDGAYIRLESGATGFCPRKELEAESKKKHPSEMVQPGKVVEYKITGIYRQGVYKVSCRKAEERAVAGRIFVVSRVEFAMLLELDLVKVNFYPHSNTVERLERYDESEKRFIPAVTGATF